MQKMAKSKVGPDGKKLKKKINRDVAKVLNKNSMVKDNILAMNPYLDSLLRPDTVKGAKIPDLVLFPSAPFTVVDRRGLTANASGFCGISYGVGGQTSAIPQGSLTPIANGVASATDYAVGMSIEGASNSKTDIYSSTTPGTYIKLPNWVNGNDQIPKTFEKVRLVSMGVEAQYTSSALNAKGTVTLAMAPRNTVRGLIGGGNVTLDRIRQIPGSRVVAVNQLQGGRVLYKPQDAISLTYTDQDFAPASAYGNQDWISSLQCGAAAGAEIFIFFEGCNSGDTAVITAYFNYEGIPRLNTNNIISTSPSESDPLALSQAMNVIQETPSTVASSFQNSQRAISDVRSSMKVHSASEHKHPNVLNSILKGIGSVGSIIEKGAPIVKMIGSMFA